MRVIRAVARRGLRLIKPSGTIGWTSETSKCRARLAKFCVGYGVDVGCGGDPIVDHAIRIDLPAPYANVGIYTVQLGGDGAKLSWFADEVLDFVYSSHLLEDFPEPHEVLRAWWSVLKVGGHLILFCPDEQAYRTHCDSAGQPHNPCHKHSEFSLAHVKKMLPDLGMFEIVHENPLVDIYSWELVVKKL